jgi:hypothetical protein
MDLKMNLRQQVRSTASALLMVIAAFICTMPIAQAATLVSGAITANTAWTLAQSPYQITADVTVDNGATLTIEAGVTVYLDAATNLTITNGALSARGSAGQPITFTSPLDTAGTTPAAGDWGQIRFQNATNDSTTVIENAQIRYGKGITVQAASPTFNNLQISNNQGSAISIDLNSSPKGVGNQATGNTLNGISVPAGDVQGSVTWGIKGIPYVVTTGTVSVGSSPTISAITPADIQQSLPTDTTINGTRLTGTDTIQFDSPGITATLTGNGTDTALPVRITASATQPLGKVPFQIKTAAGWARYPNGINIIPLKPTIAVNSITPNNMRRAETKSFQINGTSLQGAQVNVPAGTGLTLNNLLTTATQANFNLTTTATAALGSQTLSVSNPAIANGIGAMLLTIIDTLPKINTNTIPSAVIPDAIARPFTLSLTNVDIIDHSFNLSAQDPTIISITPATVTIPAGSTSAAISIAGLKLGYTLLNITSPTLAAVGKQVYASNLLNGAVVDPLLSPLISVKAPDSFSSLPLNTLSSSIRVDSPSPYGTVTSANSYVITVNAQVSNGAVNSLHSSMITVDTPPQQVGPVVSPKILVRTP